MKNIIILCDSTGNEISENISNALKFYRCLRKTDRSEPRQMEITPSKRLRQSGLSQDRVGGVAAGDADGHGKIPLRDRAMPDFVAATSLPDQRAAGGAQQIPQGAIELRRHSARGRFGFAQRSDLQKQRFRSDVGVIVWQQIERHRGNLLQKFIERRCIGRCGNIVAVPAPD